MRKSLTYTNSECSFSIDYPADWDVREGLYWVGSCLCRALSVRRYL